MDKIKSKILKGAEKDYKTFSQTLIPNINNVLGVRLPVLRKIAKEVYTDNPQEFLKQSNFEFMEEIMLQGMVIGLIEENPEEILKYVRDFIPKINNWAVCDSFCTGLKFTNKNKELVWNFIQPYFLSNQEFEIRFACVMLLTFFIEDEYIDRILNLIDKFKDKRYYARMGAAWALSICYVKYPDKTLKYMHNSNLDNWTFNKSIQKICESLRVKKDDKNMLKNLKRK